MNRQATPFASFCVRMPDTRKHELEPRMPSFLPLTQHGSGSMNTKSDGQLMAHESASLRACRRVKALLPNSSHAKTIVAASFILYGLACLPTLWRMASPLAQSDIFQHTQIANGLISSGQWISYSLFFPLSHFATLGEANELTTRVGVTLLLAAFIGLKSVGILLSAALLVRSWGFAWLVTAFAMVSMALPSGSNWKDIYLGQLNANVWHNSTTIVASAFVIPAFTAFLFFLKHPTRYAAISGAVFLALTTTFKPSFALVFLPAVLFVGGITLLKLRASLKTWAAFSLMLLPTVAVISVQFVVTFANPSSAFPSKEPVLAPFEVWQRYSPNIVASVVASLFCLAIVTIVLLIHRVEALALSLAWASIALAVILYALIGERDKLGAVVLDGNWTWSAVPAVLCGFFVACIGLSRLAQSPLTRVWGVAGFVILAPHALVGLYYLLVVGSSIQPTFIMN
jgi:hypothetical protein